MVSWVFIPPKLNIYTINSEKKFKCPPPFKYVYAKQLMELWLQMWQLVTGMRFTINQQESKDRHDDGINYHEAKLTVYQKQVPYILYIHNYYITHTDIQKNNMHIHSYNYTVITNT